MKKRSSLYSLLLVGTLILACGCRKKNDLPPIITEGPAPETEIGGYILETQPETRPDTPKETEPITLPITERETSSLAETDTCIYIGSNGSFRSYPYNDGDIITPDSLIAAIAARTGWNLDLADTVTTGPDSMTVCFADTGTLFTGIPESQNEAFHMYSSEQLCATILDSIQHTLQYNFADPQLGDPLAFEIYYCMGDNEPLYLPLLDITISMEEPYQGLSF